MAPLGGEPVINLNFEAQTYLKEAAKWASFLGIVGFIMCGLLLIGAFFVGAFFSVLSNLSPAYSQMPAGFIGILSSVIVVSIILCDILYFFFALYLYQFGSRIKKGLAFTDSNHVAGALGKLKSFFKLCGIVTIVVLCLDALEIAFVVIAGLTSLHH